MGVWLPAMCAALVLMSGCGDGPATPAAPRSRVDEQEWFTERAQATGLDFVHFNGMSGEFYDAEIFGPGVALLDYDNDGDLDVYLVQG